MFISPFINRLFNFSKITLGTVIFAGAAVSPALADPVPPPPPQKPPLPTVFCFRFTDIKQSTGDPENNRFEFEFEALNWSNQPASGIDLSFNTGTGFKKVVGQAPSLDGAGVDENGRGIGDDSTPPPGNQPKTNNWTVTTRTGDPDNPTKKTAAVWSAGTPISNIDLLGILNTLPSGATTQDIIDQVNENFPSFAPDFNPPNPQTGNPGVPETIDNGPNVLDGFVFALDDFDVGEVASFNWLLLKEDGTPIGTTRGGNPYGFGTVNLTRIKPGDPLPGPVFRGNTGFLQAGTLFYDDIFHIKDEDGNVVAEFAAEFGASLIPPYLFSADNVNNIAPNTNVVPEPLTILGASAAFGFGAFFKRKGSNKSKNKP